MRAAQLLVATAAYHANINLQEVEQFLAGFIDHLVYKQDLPELQKCLTDGDVVVKDVNDIINDFMKGDLADIVKGVEAAIALVKALPTDLAECKNVEDDVKKITTWISQAATPSGLAHIAENVMANWSNIQTDIGTITTDVQTDKFEDAGEQTGDILELALGKIQYSEKDKAYDWGVVRQYNPDISFNPIF